MVASLKVVSASDGWPTLSNVKKPTSMKTASRDAGYLCEQRLTTSGASSSNCTSMATKPSLSVPPNYARRCGKRWRGCITTTKNKEDRNCLKKMVVCDTWCHYHRVRYEYRKRIETSRCGIKLMYYHLSALYTYEGIGKSE